MTNRPHDDAWPTPEADTVVVNRERDTLVGAPPPPPPAAPVPPPDGPHDRRIGAGMLLGLAAVLLVLAGIVIAWLLTHRSSNDNTSTAPISTVASTPAATKKVAVPRVVGLKEQEALVRLAQVGLRPKEVYKPTKQPKSVVVSQKPQEAAEVKKGSQVVIVIDSGAPKVSVPDLTGQSVKDAQAALDKLGLDSTVTQVTSDQNAGTIVDQAPKDGAKLAKGSTVTLSVAKAKQQPQAGTPAPATTTQTPQEPQTATVPDVTGQTEAAGVSALGQAGILPSLAFIPGDDPLGTIEGQAKQAGERVPYHSRMQINLSSGPGDKPQQTIPNTVGQTLQQAVSTLNGAHLRLIYLRIPASGDQVGKVVQQSPLGGGKAPQNAQILVFLGTK